MDRIGRIIKEHHHFFFILLIPFFASNSTSTPGRDVPVALTIVLVAATFVQSHQLPYLGRTPAREVRDCFDMMSLREHVEGGDGIEAVSAFG
jgi:hypothetical protein